MVSEGKMADRTSCHAFSRLFRLLAKKPDGRAKELARELWELALEYDFTPSDLFCDTALEDLDLRRRGVDPEEPERGETWVYGAGEKTCDSF